MKKKSATKPRLIRDKATRLIVTAGNPPRKHLAPPQGYSSWLAYAVAGMDTRSLQNDHDWGNQPQWPDQVSREEMAIAAKAELSRVAGSLRAATTKTVRLSRSRLSAAKPILQ